MIFEVGSRKFLGTGPTSLYSIAATKHLLITIDNDSVPLSARHLMALMTHYYLLVRREVYLELADTRPPTRPNNHASIM